MTGGTMFDPFPTFPLPPCNASGGPPMEPTATDLLSLEDARRPASAFAAEYDPDDEPCTGARGCRCGSCRFEEEPGGPVTDGHHEGDPAPVIGWGESVKRNVSDYLRRREAIAAGEKDPGPRSEP